jgi:hypothetical protein
VSLALSKAQLGRYIRLHAERELYDESCEPRGGIAVYTLSDPRDLRTVRYVGQTSLPERRFLQHMNAARLWLPDERPWWVKNPKLRPLYEWVRTLYRDDLRLPTMVVCSWAQTPAAARLAERARICECLARDLPLLNIEAQRKGDQLLML